MDFTSSSGSWIYAYQSSGGPLNSNSQSAAIKQHNEQATFTWSFADAKGGNSVNPLLSSSGTSTGTTSGSTSSGYTSTGSSGGGNSHEILIVHGVLASLAFVILFPAGAITIRLASFTGVVWFHAAFQVFAYIVYIAAFGWASTLQNRKDYSTAIIPLSVSSS